MKQNEMNLVSQGIWGSSKALSDMISRPEIIKEDFLPSNTLFSAFEYYNAFEPDSPVFQNVDWTKSFYFNGPD